VATKKLYAVAVVLAVLVAGWAVVLAASHAAVARQDRPPDELPLGRPGLEETRSAERVAPGVTYTRVVRGETSKKDFYTVDVAF